jgi:hypothetical protein
MSQIMVKHSQHVKNIMLGTRELNKDMFLIEQDVKVLSWKLVQETYQLHKNNVKSVRMWVQQNTNSMLYYEKNWGRDGWLSHWTKHVFHFEYPNTVAKGDDD